MRIIDALLGEHGVLYGLFDHVESELESGRDPTPYARLLDEVLRAHAHAEDDLLFDEMAAALGREEGPAAAMMGEHGEISELLDRTRRVEGSDLRAALQEIIALARDHFRREEEAAFPMAEELFDPSRLREMGTAWGARRDVRLRGSHER